MAFRSVLGRQVIELATEGYEALDRRLKSIFDRMRSIASVNDRINRQQRGLGGGGRGRFGTGGAGGFGGGSSSFGYGFASSLGIARFGGAAGLGLGAGAGIGLTVKTMADFEQQLADIRKTTGASEDELGRFKQGIMDLADGMRVSRSDLATISALAGQQGLSDPSENLRFTRSTAMMAATSDMGPEEAATRAAQILNVFKLTTNEVDNLNSMLTKLASTTTATEGQLADMLLRAGGTGQMIGITAEEVAAMAATLRDLGVQIEISGTAMSKMFTLMATGLPDLAKVLGMPEEELKALIDRSPWEAFMKINEELAKMDKFKRAEAIQSLSLEGDRAFVVAEKLSSNLDMLTKNLDISNKAFANGKAHIEEYEAGTDTLWGRVTQLGNALQNLPEQLEGAGLLQWLKESTDQATLLVQKLPEVGKSLEGYIPDWIKNNFSPMDLISPAASAALGVAKNLGGKPESISTDDQKQGAFGFTPQFADQLSKAIQQGQEARTKPFFEWFTKNMKETFKPIIDGVLEVGKHEVERIKKQDEIWAQADTPDPGWVIEQNKEKRDILQEAAKEMARMGEFRPQTFGSGTEHFLSLQAAAMSKKSGPEEQARMLKEIKKILGDDLFNAANEVKRKLSDILDEFRDGTLVISG